MEATARTCTTITMPNIPLREDEVDLQFNRRGARQITGAGSIHRAVAVAYPRGRRRRGGVDRRPGRT